MTVDSFQRGVASSRQVKPNNLRAQVHLAGPKETLPVRDPIGYYNPSYGAHQYAATCASASRRFARWTRLPKEGTVIHPRDVHIFEAGGDGIEVAALASEASGQWSAPADSATGTGADDSDDEHLAPMVPAATLLIARQGDDALAHVYLSPVGAYGLDLFGAGFGNDLGDEGLRTRAVEAIVRCCKAIARGYAGVRYMATDMLLDSSTAVTWREVLSRQGFQAIAESYNHTLELLPGLSLAPAGPLSFRRCDSLPPEVVRVLYEAAYQGSGDQAHQHSCEPYDVRLERLMTYPFLQPNRAGWLVGFEGDRPIGVVFASLEAAEEGDSTTGWMAEIGVVPEARGRGFGRVLLEAGLAALAEQGAQRVHARIDTQNAASLRLLAAAGFVRQPEVSWLYQWNVTPSGPD